MRKKAEMHLQRPILSILGMLLAAAVVASFVVAVATRSGLRSAGGSGQTRITNNPANDSSPAWPP